MNPPNRRLPLIPRIILGAFALLAMSWLAFMLHFIFVGSKQLPRPDPLFQSSPAITNPPTSSGVDPR